MTVTVERAAYVLARGFDYFGGALFLGGLAFVALLWPEGARAIGTRRVVVTGWLLGLLGTVAAIGLEGVWVSDRPFGDAFRTDLLGQVLDLDFGRVWFARALLWVLAGVVLTDLLRRGEHAARSAAWRVGAGAVGLGLLRTNGMVGHTMDAPTPLWAQLAGILHLTGIVLWVGGLAVLLLGLLPRRRPEELAAVVPRYSRLAMVSVALIVTGGLVLTWQLVGSVGALFATDYGRLLLVKVAIFALVLVIAQASRSWVAHRLDFAVVLRGDAATVRPFVYSVAAETTLVVFVLVAASLLVTASPGR
ncbi:copper resistance D family protein [Actinophytocola sp.]|uniref:copper resistance D family protein n=1 Tax=Actinophytocola sp. TaxID=1872138 RepID=UPI002ED2B58D